MGGQRGQAWLTCVTRSEKSLIRALVLAESLRRTYTTKRLAVIITTQVGKPETEALHNAFDDVICLNENLILPLNTKRKKHLSENELVDELRAKIFSFSLEVYDKCVFVSPDTIMLENCDTMFENTENPAPQFNGESDKIFVFSPKWAVCQFLKERYEQRVSCSNDGSWSNFICKSVQAWTKNNEFGEILKQKLNFNVTKFSIKTGKALGVGTYGLPSVVQFIDADLCVMEFAVRLNQFNYESMNMSVLEQTIVATWMNIYENSISKDTLDIKSSVNGSANETYRNELIAIVGMSCRFPGANNLEEFWNLLHDGNEGIQQPPSFRWKDEHSIFGGSGKERNTRAGFLATPIDEFDAKFFGLSPKEALFLDPQARLLHELVWEGLENSGIDPLSLRGSHTGLFTGSWMNDYKDLVQTSTEKDFFRTYMGNSMGATAARLSFMLGVTGPSIATESGCSSAIVAVDLAVKSLRSGETNLALAGGVNLLLHPFQGDIIEYVISPDGRCKTFDANANGFARAEGCGVLVLKRLSDALRDRDNIWAMVRGSAISQEGLSRSLGTPTVHCEALAMKLAMVDAGVLPEQVSFVESHGTGTIVGDPMEIAAITKTYGSKRRSSPLVIGSVKTNVGHTESCSGITGIIKTVLAMHNEVIPQHLNLETINPQIKLDVIPAIIPLEPLPWPKVEGIPRLAGVSSFGITGTDGHVIIQEPPSSPSHQIITELERPLHIVKFSGKTTYALDELIGLYEHYLSQNTYNTPITDLAYTANTGRASFNHRAFILAGDTEQVEKSLRDNKLVKGEVMSSDHGKICFMFTGQGSQYAGMANSLYGSSPVFRMHFDYCNRLLCDQYNLSIINVLWGESSKQELNRTIYSQTSIFCIEYCLLKLWESWGIQPDYVLGHSLGEFCAVVAAGIISFEDALKLVVTRSQLIDQLESGSMLVIKASLKDVEQLMKDTNISLDIAAVNSHEQTVVAGDTAEILQLLDFCKMRSIKAVKLETTHAFHSRHMDCILDEYRKVAETIQVSQSCSSDCQYISGMDGKLVENPANEINADYWVRHTRNKVAFLDACQAMKQLGCQNFLEIGPQPILSTFVMQNIEFSTPINCYPSLRRKASDWETILTSLGKLYLQGYPINWEGFDKPYNRKKISSLPTYPFQRKSFWVDCSNTNVAPIHPLIGFPISNASPLNIFQHSLNLKSVPYLKDHCIGNRIIMPGAAFTEMCLSAAYCVANSLRNHFEQPTRPISLENVRIEAPLELKEENACRVQVIVNLPSDSDDAINENETQQPQKGFCVKVFHQKNSDTDTSGKWIHHASAAFHLVPNFKELDTKWNLERTAAMIQKTECPLSNGFYKRISDLGLKFGESFKSIGRHWRSEEENGNDEIVVEMKIPLDHDSYILHPVIIDAMLQTGILTQLRNQTEVLRVPVRIGQLIWLGNVGASGDKNVLYLHAWWNKETGKCNILAVNEDLTMPVAFLSDLELVETNVKTIESILKQQNSPLPDIWEEVWKPISGPHESRAKLTDLKPVLTSQEFHDKIDAAVQEEPEGWTRFQQVSKLIYLEILKSDRETTFSFGVLENYWRFEDFDCRPNHPCVGGSKWKQILLNAGFKYVNVNDAYYGSVGCIYAENQPLIAQEDDDEEANEVDNENSPHWIIFSTRDDVVLTQKVSNILQQCKYKVNLIWNESGKVDGILGSDENVQGIIYMTGMNGSLTDQTDISRPLLHIIKKVLDVKKPPRLYIFTSGVHAINGDAHLITNPSAATLFGMVKSLKNENSDLFVRYVDLDDNSNAELMTEQIMFELALHKDSKERERVQIAYRNCQRYEPKLTKCLALGHRGSSAELKLPLCSERYRVVLPESRLIQDLEFDVLEEELVGGNEVEIKVEAYSLNFRDIVAVLKPIAQFEDVNSMGLDLAGVVTKVGNGVLQNKLEVGDRVFGINYKENCALNSHIMLEADRLLRIPNGMTFTEAASLPAVFATSLHCLVSVAQVKAGETVLIHTGSGGVGLSAIQVARNIGARIITTAGNERKRAYLRGNLGIEHVFHSRDTTFEKEIMKVTDGRGVVVVLNSITGPGMKEASLKTCAPGARFVEMSKLSVWTEEEVKALRPDVKYTIVDLTKLEVECWKSLLETTEKYLKEDRLMTLPYVKFDVLRIKHALQYFQKASHIGKVLVTMPKVKNKDGEWMTQVPLFNGDSTYIITGGLGGIGFEVCKWMLEKGATDIVLIGRNPPKPEIAKEMERLRNDKKCNLFVILGDVGDFEGCKSIFEKLTAVGCKPIRGIQHCAGILRNNLYCNQTWETFDETFNPKVKGTWNLHILTSNMSLEHFILYSSLTANVGSPGQSNHSAANCFEDAFAHYRYSLGLPGTSINWGQWAQVGCARETNVSGLQPVSVDHMLKGLEMTLRTNKVRVTIANFESFASFSALCPFFKHYIDERLLKNDNKQTSFNLPKSDQFWGDMDSAETAEKKMEVACGYIKTVLRSALRMEPDEPISEDADLQEIGVDSLMAIELKNSIQGLMGSRLTVTATMLKDSKTIKDVASVLVAKIYDEDSNQGSLSPEEIEALLNNDCKLDDTIWGPSEISGKVTAMEKVLITGVTGQLGPYILSLLSQNPAYQTLNSIVCVVRVQEGKCPEEKLRSVLNSMKLTEKVDMSKVTCVRGDVTLPNFGLEQDAYADLCASVDGIFHLAVKSNHIEIYRKVENGTKDIRSVNVGGTLNVLRFAATTKTKKVYYAGALISVFGGSDEGTLCDDWPERGQIKAIVEHNVIGYPASKYVCEMLIKQANERGIPCKVFRFPWITGESNTGRLNYANNQYILRFLSYLKIKSIPDAPIPAVVLPVDICADLSLKLFWNDEAPNEVYNIAHPKPELEAEFINVAREHFGVELEIVDWRSKEFVEKLYGYDMPLEALKEIYTDVDRGIAIANSGAFQAIQGYLREPENFFKNKKVETYIPGFSTNISTSMEAIKRCLEFVRSEGLFAKFGL